MKFDKFVLPEILDKTRGLRKLKFEERGSTVPFLLDTVKVTQNLFQEDYYQPPYQDQELSLGTDPTRLQKERIIEEWYRTHPTAPTGARVHLQGRVYLHKVEYYVTPTDLAGSESWLEGRRAEYEYPIIPVRDLLNPAKGTVKQQKPVNPVKELVLGWDYPLEEYDFSTRVHGSIVKKPKYEPTKLIILSDRTSCGQYRIHLPRILGQESRKKFLADKERVQKLRYLTGLWIANRTPLDLQLEERFYQIPIGFTVKTNSTKVPTLLEEVLEEQYKTSGAAIIPKTTKKRSYLVYKLKNSEKEYNYNIKKLRRGKQYHYYW
jgi:hypothetical protein